MPSKETLTLKIDQMAFGGEGLGTFKGKKVFIPGGVAGDLVQIEVIENKRDYVRGKITQILEKSPQRSSPVCPYFFKCGGCQWQHIDYASQIAYKQELLQSSLQRIGKIENPKLKEPIPCDLPYHYRNRIRLQVSRQGEIGFFKPSSKELVAIEACSIAIQALNEKIPEAKQLAQRLRAQDQTKRHEIEIKLEDEKVIVEADPQGESLFSQVNVAQNERLIQRVVESLTLSGKENLLELYAGTGNFSFALAKKVKTLTAVESHPGAVEEAKKKIEQKHIRNLSFVESTSYRYLQHDSLRPDQFQVLLIDPPRSGAIDCLESIAKLKIPKILYVSCDPSTLARDLKILMTLGYQHDFSQLIDMFPQTYHIESINLLTLKNQH